LTQLIHSRKYQSSSQGLILNGLYIVLSNIEADKMGLKTRISPTSAALAAALFGSSESFGSCFPPSVLPGELAMTEDGTGADVLLGPLASSPPSLLPGCVKLSELLADFEQRFPMIAIQLSEYHLIK
jgi:hypothetical protein